jgi:hypothetical protein
LPLSLSLPLQLQLQLQLSLPCLLGLAWGFSPTNHATNLEGL